ncbi:MAG: hypothetical protein L6V84_02230 [Oscillospiraceae bacterium]|nr:MAG: hypothetical protein L6V84_02230 [Oscillospiraceae bacterium]
MVAEKLRNRSTTARNGFTEEELSAKGLAGLTAPTGLSGEMNSSDAWYNDGYSFFAGLSGRRDVQDECRNIFFSYLKKRIMTVCSVNRETKNISMDTNENWYIIEQKNDLSNYFADNPSKLYKFYYVRNNTLDNGYFAKGSVWIFLKFAMNSIPIPIDTNSNCLLKAQTHHITEFTRTIIKIR